MAVSESSISTTGPASPDADQLPQKPLHNVSYNQFRRDKNMNSFQPRITRIAQIREIDFVELKVRVN
jgi:hypothetical protein